MQDPIGFWDPLGGVYYVLPRSFNRQGLTYLAGLSADKDEATFKRRRAVEIKHGRIVVDSGMSRSKACCSVWTMMRCFMSVISVASPCLSLHMTLGHVCHHGIYRSGVLQVSRVLEPKFESQIQRRPERTGSTVQVVS